MFSGNTEKRMPRDLKSCYRTNPLVNNLWKWCEWLENAGFVVFLILVLLGVIYTINDTSTAKKLVEDIGDEAINELRKQGVEIPSPLSVCIDSATKWALIAIGEFLTYHVLALLVGSLASIVQHNKISADVALYRAAKEYSDEADINGQASDGAYRRSTPVPGASNGNEKTDNLAEDGERSDSVPDISEKEFEKDDKIVRNDIITIIACVVALAIAFLVIAYIVSR